jgi:hypothetical protein
MKTNQSRREFLSKSSKLGLICGVFACCPKVLTYGRLWGDDTIPDPKKLNYCGYVCPDDCKMKMATLKDDVEMKKEVYTLWRIEEKYGIEFDPEKLFCFGCKSEGKPLGLVVEKCTVRKCAIEKGYDCCIECNDLTECDKEIWKTFPDFHNAVIEMQKKYRAAKG